jgi:hypothetical protein
MKMLYTSYYNGSGKIYICVTGLFKKSAIGKMLERNRNM